MSVVVVLTMTFLVIALVSLWRRRREVVLPGLLPPPGPQGLPLLGHLPFLLGRDLHRSFADLAAIHGPVMTVRMGMKHCVVISSPAAVREVLRDHDAVFANRDPPAASRGITRVGEDIVWSSNGPTWRTLRKVCVRELLNPSSIDVFYALRRREMRRTVAEVWRRAGEAREVGEVAFQTALNVTMSMLWGAGETAPKEEEGEDERSRVAREFRQVMDGIVGLVGEFNVSDFFPVLARFDLNGVERRMGRYMDWFERIMDQLIAKKGIVRLMKNKKEQVEADDIDQKRSRSRSSRDFLEVMLEQVQRSGAQEEVPLTLGNVKAVFLNLVSGGSDTSATTVEWAMAEMMNKPEILRKAREELDTVVGRDALVEESHIPRLHYLDAVVKETLRLHPIVPLLVPRCPSASCAVGGYVVPAGATVFVNAWAVHRDTRFWEDPLAFKPDRFLIGDAARFDYRGQSSDFRYIPFGSGRRICVGLAMGERMTMYMLATFLHSFEWRLPPAEQIVLTEKLRFVLRMAKPLVAIPTPRLSNPELYT